MDTKPWVSIIVQGILINNFNKMEKLNLNKLQLKDEEMLRREQMTTVYGGSGACKVFVRTSGGAAYWTARDYSVDQAQFYYNSGTWGSGSNTYQVTGYCCANCP
jgi:hypothetical protein